MRGTAIKTKCSQRPGGRTRILSFPCALFAVILLVCSALTLVPCPVYAECLKDARTVALGEGAARIRSYVCAESDGTAVRVEFHRLSEHLAGNLLAGRVEGVLGGVIGPHRVLKNPVYEEAKLLFDRYGTKSEWHEEFHYRVLSPEGVAGEEDGTQEQAVHLVHCLSDGARFDDGYGSPFEVGVAFPMPDAETLARAGRPWHRDLNLFYPDCYRGDDGGIEGSCIYFWRFLGPDDVRDYEKNWRRQRALFGDEGALVLYASSPDERAMKLLGHLTSTHWPRDFALLLGNIAFGECVGAEGGFVYLPRRLILDLAVIENISDRALKVDALRGAQILTKDLRPTAQSLRRKKLKPGELPVGDIRLAPGEKMVLPLRMSFPANDSLKQKFSDEEAKKSEQRYTEVKTRPERFIAVEAGSFAADEIEGYWLRAMGGADSLSPPRRPELHDYIYGPEVTLRGLDLEGNRLSLEGRAANYLEVTASAARGSCPYLYAWSEEAQDWVNYRKVIHTASSRALEATEIIRLAEPATRFRLMERELELAFIDRAALHVELDDGTRLSLAPGLPLLAERDEKYLEINAGDDVEFAFDLPADLPKDRIRGAELEVTGHYLRHGSDELLSLLRTRALAAGTEDPGGFGEVASLGDLAAVPGACKVRERDLPGRSGQ